MPRAETVPGPAQRQTFAVPVAPGLHPSGDVDPESIEEQLIAYSVFKLLRYGSIITALAMLLGVLAVPAIASSCRRQASLAANVWVWAVSAVGALGYFWLRSAAAEANESARRDSGIYKPLRTDSSEGPAGIYKPPRTDSSGSLPPGGATCVFLETMPACNSIPACDDHNKARTAPIGSEHRPRCYPALAAAQGRCCGEPTALEDMHSEGLIRIRAELVHTEEQDEQEDDRLVAPMGPLGDLQDMPPSPLPSTMPGLIEQIHSTRYSGVAQESPADKEEEPWQQVASDVARIRGLSRDPSLQDGQVASDVARIRGLARDPGLQDGQAAKRSLLSMLNNEDTDMSLMSVAEEVVRPQHLRQPGRSSRNQDESPPRSRYKQLEPHARTGKEGDRASRPHDGRTASSSSTAPLDLGEDRVVRPGDQEGIPVSPPRAARTPLPKRILRNPEAEELVAPPSVWGEFDTDSPPPPQWRGGPRVGRCPGPSLAPRAEDRNSPGRRSPEAFFERFDDTRLLEADLTEPLDRLEVEEETPFVTTPSKLPFVGAYAVLAFFVIIFCGVAGFGIFSILRPLPDRMPLTTAASRHSPQRWPPLYANGSGKAQPYWQAGPWSHCSTGCGAGTRRRDVRCAFGSPKECEARQGEAPEASRVCREYLGCQWRAGEWGQCSATCGRGEQRRVVLCTNSQIADCFKDLWTVPNETKECLKVDGCRWEAHAWGPCSTTCGVGERRRSTTCVNGDERFCEERGGRPEQAEACESYEMCRWNVSGWSACSERCGRGTRTRDILCPGGNESDCLSQDGDPPSAKEACHDVSGCRWVTTSWSPCSGHCGSGTQTRNASCVGGSEEDCAAHADSPALEQPCKDAEACQWTSDWSACTSTCGTGRRNRNVACSLDSGGVPDVCRATPGLETAVFAEACLNVSGCRWLLGEWSACSSQCGSGMQQRMVACRGGRPEDCARREAAPDAVRPCNRTSNCSSTSGRAAPPRTSAGCPRAAKDPALMVAGALNALVGWMVSFAGLHELQHHGVVNTRSTWAALLAPNAILLTGFGALAAALPLSHWMLPGSGDAQKAALAGSALATGLLCLGLYVASLCCVTFHSGSQVLLAGGKPRQVQWLASGLALLAFCCAVLVVAAWLAFGQAGEDGR